MVFSLSRNVSSVTVPGLKHSSSNMAKIPFWFWAEEEEEEEEEGGGGEREGGHKTRNGFQIPKHCTLQVFTLLLIFVTGKAICDKSNKRQS